MVGFTLYQSHCIHKILTKFKYLDIKEVNIPYNVSNKLIENLKRSVSQLDYTSAIGSLMYIMHCTKFDICNTLLNSNVGILNF